VTIKCDNGKLLQKYCEDRTLSCQQQRKIWRKLLFHNDDINFMHSVFCEHCILESIS